MDDLYLKVEDKYYRLDLSTYTGSECLVLILFISNEYEVGSINDEDIVVDKDIVCKVIFPIDFDVLLYLSSNDTIISTIDVFDIDQYNTVLRREKIRSVFSTSA